MITLLTILAAAALFGNLYALIDIGLGLRQMRALGEILPCAAGENPLVSIIVPACNEAEAIEPALHSLFALDYDNIEILVVNDRSTDATSGILDKLQNEFPALQILTITELPEGWLGKNNALQQGALRAKGEYLLFTDADILFSRTTLSRAISLVQQEKLDHLSLIFKNTAEGALLNALIVDAGGGLLFLFKPWKVSDPQSKRFMGVGAFNLFRQSVYAKIGGHESIKTHPIDDIMLGKVIKEHGYKQECLMGQDFLRVRWYDSTRAMIQGLMKNVFALYDFKISRALAGVCMIFLLTILPLWLALLGSGPLRLFGALSVCLRLLSALYGARISGVSSRGTVFSFLTPYINMYIIVKAVFTTVRNNGIRWRGSFYSLDKLKESPSLF